ncbi:hypothetical protein MMC25_001274 [Agyrium rufum]|nr:hypothetical protein [Agyrium rufum]
MLSLVYVLFLSLSILVNICDAEPLPEARSVLEPQSKPPKTPNVVFIVTDDQDLHLDSLSYMPLLKKYLADQGTTYQKHYSTVSLCCPSRVSLWTGRAAHNTNVTDVSPPYGGYPKFISQGLNQAWLPMWLQQAGISTYYVGKLMNSHGITNYNKPFPAGFTGSEFLLEPYTYQYFNTSWQRSHEAPVKYPGQYTSDLTASKSLAFIDDAAVAKKPFMLTISPIAPHANVVFPNQTGRAGFSEPEPDAKRANLFPNVKVPRSVSFNAKIPSGANWVSRLAQQNETVIDYFDHFYRQRLRSLQNVDEMIESVVNRLEQHGILDNTYIVYTSDNGYHIGQHRMAPGKTCGYEEDVNVPFIVRGPGVPKRLTTDIVSSHTDLAPTFLNFFGVKPRPEFDGTAIPVSERGIREARVSRQEHVNIEFWGTGAPEGTYGFSSLGSIIAAALGNTNNTYKSLRLVGSSYSLYYSVWCSGEHEVYDMTVCQPFLQDVIRTSILILKFPPQTDPHQMNNLYQASLSTSSSSSAPRILGHPLHAVISRLDALLLVLKSCKAISCRLPWKTLHPNGKVNSLQDALNPAYDSFYASQPKVAYSSCEPGYIIIAEGPQDAYAYRLGTNDADWV